VNDDPEQLDRHVEDLLQDRRPERTPLPDEDALRARQAAAMLKGARPGAGLPTRQFLERMQQSIQQWVGEQSVEPSASPARPSRRSLLITGAAGLAAGVAAGVAAVVGLDQVQKQPPPVATPALVRNGSWRAVMALADMPESTPVSFRSGAIEGFLIRRGQEVEALSAVCTHMGCILNYSTFRQRFECPCHGATFDLTGQSTNHYERTLRPLPRLKTRVQQGQVEVYTV
jgi:nitrite reductase/ring-hydroxylating ferredoxin subunit